MTDISPKQLEANQTNAKKGGVKTEEGKAVSKYNALKHGLLSREVLLKDESEADLIALGKKLRTQLTPATELELVLVDRIIANVWRLRRIMQIEREVIAYGRDGAGNFMEVDSTTGMAFTNDAANHDTYGKLIRYEASVERGIYKALHELERRQAAQRGEHVPLPIPVEVSISGEKT